MTGAALTITVPGPLRGKARPRFSRGHTHTTPESIAAERSIAWHAVQQVGQRALQGALQVRIDVAVSVPSSWSEKRRGEALGGAVRPVCKPDVDNAAKLVLDALTGVLWRDDSQVTELTISRRYAAEDSSTITVRTA